MPAWPTRPASTARSSRWRGVSCSRCGAVGSARRGPPCTSTIAGGGRHPRHPRDGHTGGDDPGRLLHGRRLQTRPPPARREGDLLQRLGPAMKVVVVTGGASGIGAATSRRLALDGFHVVVADIDEVGAKEVAVDIGGEALYLDVTDGEAVRSALGGRAVDVLVSNAGGDRIAFFLDTTPAEWDAVLALNLTGTMACTHAVLPG